MWRWVTVIQRYALESLESSIVILETKDGAYAPLTEEDYLKNTNRTNLNE